MLTFEQFQERAREANVIPVIETMPADLLTPLAVYLKLAPGRGESFLLESVEGGETLARYSFIGAGPEISIRGNAETVEVRKGEGKRKRTDQGVLEFLRGHFGRYRLFNDADLPSFAGGAIGSLAFSCSAWFEPSLRRVIPAADDEAEFMFFRTVIAFDHAKQVIKIVSLVFTEETSADNGGLRGLFDDAVKSNGAIRELLETGPVQMPRRARTGSIGTTESNFSQRDFEAAVTRVKDYIAAGDAYQVVLSQRFVRPTSATPVAVYRAMRSLNPSPYMFLLDFGDRAMIGASPEMLVRGRGRDLEYRPIAGTRPRSADASEDARLAEEMRRDMKEVAEHLMLVDLGRNDLGRVAEYGSVKVDDLMNVEKYSHVQHLVSQISARLRDGSDRFDALAACFPAGTVSGAPKVRAIEIIRELEPTDRGLYSGAVGYFDYSGNMDTCIAIRTITLKDGVAHIQAGAGIVADSDPAAEYQETVNKASAQLRAIEIAEEAQL